MSQQFIGDSVRNQIADKLGAAFFHYYRYRPSHQEVDSWRNSLRAMAQLIDYNKLHDHGVMLEYQLPLSSKRLDCLVCGRDREHRDNAVIVELKQWQQCESADEAPQLGEYLRARLDSGCGSPVLQRIEQSRYRPSRKLMDHVAETISSKSPWILLDEQLVAFSRILSTIKSGAFGRRKQVIIVHGGPGTGKSVLAINLLADLLRAGFNAHYATGSKAFTETLWKIVGTRSKPVLRYFNSYARAAFNEIDVLICDESHRIRETSNSRFTKKVLRSNKPQVQELLDVSKVAVFLIDDRQMVRPNEIGSTTYLRQSAEAAGAEVAEYELEVQFRCAGSDGFVNWVNNTLGIQRTANVLWDGAEGFEFRIFDSPWTLEQAIRQRAAEGHAARVAAGFCWSWSDPLPDGSLAEDVVIGDYKRPCDAKPGNWKLAPGIPSASLWATDANGIDQVGCVYNIQGFELDYIGVIWGADLLYDFETQQWKGDKTASADQVVKRSKEKFVDLVKNTYRVLLSRGMKGCYVCFLDKDTERFVRSRIEHTQPEVELLKVAEPGADYSRQPPAEQT